MRTANKTKPKPSSGKTDKAAKTQQPTIQQPVDLYFSMISEMLCAENLILTELPKVIELTSDQDLKTSLSDHLKQTEGHRDRLTQITGMLNRQEQKANCNSMKSLLQEGLQQAQKLQPGGLRDLAIINGCGKVEYFEMSAYRGLIMMAERLDLDSHIDLLEQTYEEEKEAAKTLSKAADKNDFIPADGQQQQQQANQQQAAQTMQFFASYRGRKSKGERSNENIG